MANEPKREVWVCARPTGEPRIAYVGHELATSMLGMGEKVVRYVPAASDQAGEERSLAKQFMRCADALETFAGGGEMGCTVSEHHGIHECRLDSLCTGCRARHRIERELKAASASGKAQAEWQECRHGYMPRPGEKVMFWCRGWLAGATPGVGTFNGDFWEDETQMVNDAFVLVPNSEVTHWQPLPPPPSSSTPGSSDG